MIKIGREFIGCHLGGEYNEVVKDPGSVRASLCLAFPDVYDIGMSHLGTKILYKIVNERPLIRPVWYFDIDIQGEGIVDTTIHLVDVTQWMLFPGVPIDYERDIELIEARRWATRVPLDKFAKITGSDQFPRAIAGYVKEDILDYFWT